MTSSAKEQFPVTASFIGAASLALIGIGTMLDVARRNGMFDFLPEYLGLKLAFIGFALDVIAALISVC
jgi:hypothetical protein